MDTVSVRDLRNKGAEVLGRVSAGESLTVTGDGEPVAVLSPVARRALSAAELIRRRKHLPRVDAARLRAELDELIDPSL